MADKGILLVEGKDDENVVRHLCCRHGLDNAFQIERCGGFEKLRKSLPVRLKQSDVNVIGILVDANTDTRARWQSLRDLLNAAYPSVPDSPARRGVILEPPASTILPRVGIWLMPDNSTSGTLESFLRFLVRDESSPLLEHAQESIDSIPNGHRLFRDKDETKALLYTWLAWQKSPGKPYGTAIGASYFDANVAPALDFIDWLRRLFL